MTENPHKTPTKPPKPRRDMTPASSWSALPHEVCVRILSECSPSVILRLRLTSATMRDACGGWTGAVSVRCIKFGGVMNCYAPRASAVRLLRSLPSLSGVIIEGTAGADDVLAEGVGGARLRSLTLHECCLVTAGGVTTALDGLPSLTKLRVVSCHLVAFAWHQRLAGMHTLQLAQVDIDAAAVSDVARGCPLLEELELAPCRHIDLAKLGWGDECCCCVWRDMHSLTLNHMWGVGPLAAAAARGCGTRLKNLDLTHCSFGVDELRAVFVHAAGLVDADVSSCACVDDDAVEVMAQHGAALRYLDLYACVCVTDVAALKICLHARPGGGCRHLYHVGVSLSSMTNVGRRWMLEACPHLQVM